MKKLTTLLVNVILPVVWLLLFTGSVLISCSENWEEKQSRRETLEEVQRYLKREIDRTSTLTYPNLYVFQYKGHEYALVTNGSGDSKVGGVLHDPECRKCSGINSPTGEEKIEENFSEYEKIFGKSSD